MNGRGPRARVRGGTLSRLAAVLSESESAAVVSAVRLSFLVVSGGATTGRGSQTLGLGGGGGAARAESRASATSRGESPQPMVAQMMTRRPPREKRSMRTAW